MITGGGRRSRGGAPGGRSLDKICPPPRPCPAKVLCPRVPFLITAKWAPRASLLDGLGSLDGTLPLLLGRRRQGVRVRGTSGCPGMESGTRNQGYGL